MVSSIEKPMSARSLPPSHLDFGVSALMDFAGSAWMERTIEKGLAWNTGVFLL